MLVLIKAPTEKPLAWADTAAKDTSRLTAAAELADSFGEQPLRASAMSSRDEKNRRWSFKGYLWSETRTASYRGLVCGSAQA